MSGRALNNNYSFTTGKSPQCNQNSEDPSHQPFLGMFRFTGSAVCCQRGGSLCPPGILIEWGRYFRQTCYE